MPPAPQQQQGQDQGSLNFLWISVLLVIAGLLVWYYQKNPITHFVYQIRFYEIHAFQFLLKYWNLLIVKLNFPFLQVQAPGLQIWYERILNRAMDPSFKTLTAISVDVGSYARFIYVPIFVILAIVVYTKSVAQKFRTIFSMKSMKLLEQQNWPQITPVVKLDLVKASINDGAWAMCASPMQFCKKNNLLKEIKDIHGKPAVEVIRGVAYRIFALQLGPLWTSPYALPIHTKALFAIFAGCANQDRGKAIGLLNQISKSSASGKLDFTGAETLFMKHYNTKLVIRVLQRHAYVLTVLASMLILARTDGVLASSDFLWLKPVDRKLWYMLNSVGRQTAFSEIAGPFAHWLAEKKWGGPLFTPMIDEAVKGLELAVSEILYEPEED